MIYDIKAHPTLYAGVQFRSRLEARWAAFFDLCKWPWEYEPIDLKGWSPDFRLKGAVPALVEVKPIVFEGDEKNIERLAREHTGKVFDFVTNNQPKENGPQWFETFGYEVLILGNGPFDFRGLTYAGGLGFFAADNWAGVEDVAVFGGGYGRPLDYFAEYQSYEYRIGGECGGDHHLIALDGPELAMSLWNEAGNRVQWRYRP